MKIVDFKCLLNRKCNNVVLIDYLIKMALGLCITSLYELCMCCGDYIGCYCIINNRALDCRMEKEEGSFRINVVEGLAVKCAYRVNW